MSKTMNKIGTIFAAATLVGATLTGAIAADLKDLPAPFVKDGKANVTIVVGQNAATADVLGSIDIASALQAASVTTTTVSVGGSKGSSVSDGANVATTSQPLLLGQKLNQAQTKLDDTDLPDLLADGTVSDESSNDDYDYDQELTLGAAPIVFGTSFDSDINDPTIALDLDTSGADNLWNYTLDFKGKSLNLVDLDDSETVTMLGKAFTFSPSITNGADVKIYGSDKTEYMTLNEPKTFVVEGKSYTVEVTGGNSDNDNVVVAVNGVSKTIEEGQTVTINGLELFAKDVFVTNIPTLSAAATLFVGSQEVTLPAAGTGWADVEINGDSVNGLQAQLTGNNSAVTGIQFSYVPTDLSNDVSGFDEKSYALVGDKISDPLFGTFAVNFVGPNYALDDSSKSQIKFTAGSDDLKFDFTNDDGDMVSFTPFKGNGVANGNLASAWAVDGNKGFNGSVSAGVPISDKQIFILNEGSVTPFKTNVFEVSGYANQSGDVVVRLKNLGTSDTADYSVSDKVIDGVTVSAINYAAKTFTLSAATSNLLYIEGGNNYVDFSAAFNGTTSNIVYANATKYLKLVETSPDGVDKANATTFILTGNLDSDGDVNVHYTAHTGASTVSAATQDNNNVEEVLSEYGTYLVNDVDNYESIVAYMPQDNDGEVHYDIFFAPTDAVVSTTGGSTVTTQVVNPIAVGTAVLDSSVALATESKNLIVVGGPCANSVAAALLKSSAANCGAGFTPGKAVVQLFDTPMGKTAMLVAGYEATETQAASRAVALMDKRLVGQSVTLTVTNTNDFTISSSQ